MIWWRFQQQQTAWIQVKVFSCVVSLILRDWLVHQFGVISPHWIAGLKRLQRQNRPNSARQPFIYWRGMFYGRPWPCNARGGGRGIAPVKVSVSDICPHGVAKQPFCIVIKQGEIKIVIVVIIIIIIILRTIFIVLSSWSQGHCESSLGSFDECRAAPSGRRPSDQATWLGLRVACRLLSSTTTIAIYM